MGIDWSARVMYGLTSLEVDKEDWEKMVELASDGYICYANPDLESLSDDWIIGVECGPYDIEREQEMSRVKSIFLKWLDKYSFSKYAEDVQLHITTHVS